MAKAKSTRLLGVFPKDNSWGHKVVVDEQDEVDGEKILEVHGWLSQPYAKEGRRFGYEMASGKIGIFEFTEVDRQDDPRDMFFGKAKGLGYADQLGYGLLD